MPGYLLPTCHLMLYKVNDQALESWSDIGFWIFLGVSRWLHARNLLGFRLFTMKEAEVGPSHVLPLHKYACFFISATLHSSPKRGVRHPTTGAPPPPPGRVDIRIHRIAQEELCHLPGGRFFRFVQRDLKGIKVGFGYWNLLVLWLSG